MTFSSNLHYFDTICSDKEDAQLINRPQKTVFLSFYCCFVEFCKKILKIDQLRILLSEHIVSKQS